MQEKLNHEKMPKGLRNYRVVPLFGSQQKHVLYDKAAFFDLINQFLLTKLDYVKMKLGGSEAKNGKKVKSATLKKNMKNSKMIATPTDDIVYRNTLIKYFRINAMEKPVMNVEEVEDLKKQLRYSGSFSTNGVDVSVHFERKKKKTRTIIQKLSSNFDHTVSIDPGYRFFSVFSDALRVKTDQRFSCKLPSRGTDLWVKLTCMGQMFNSWQSKLFFIKERKKF